MVENYFLGFNSADGFYSLYNELYLSDYRQKIYILKGGPGTGKSSIMKSIACRAEELDYNIEKIFCSSDPDSLDAVIIKDLNTVILDGTAPHILEPKYPGIIETIINLGDYWNENILIKNKNEIINLINENKNYHIKCVNEIYKAKKYYDESNIIIRKYINNKKLRIYKDNVIKDIQTTGKEKNRILTAITPKGIFTVKNNFDKEKYFISDNYNIISKYLLKNISKENIGDKILCRDFLNTKLISTIITDKNLYTDNINTDYDRIIDINDCYYTIPENKINLLNENKNIIAEKLNNAVEYSQKAKKIHNLLEKYYINAMNFDKINILANELINKIFN